MQPPGIEVPCGLPSVGSSLSLIPSICPLSFVGTGDQRDSVFLRKTSYSSGGKEVEGLRSPRASPAPSRVGSRRAEGNVNTRLSGKSLSLLY